MAAIPQAHIADPTIPTTAPLSALQAFVTALGFNPDDVRSIAADPSQVRLDMYRPGDHGNRVFCCNMCGDAGLHTITLDLDLTS